MNYQRISKNNWNMVGSTANIFSFDFNFSPAIIKCIFKVSVDD